MATAAFIPISEYLTARYEGDCDYIDGDVRKRNVGVGLHPYLMSALMGFFYRKIKEWNVLALPSVRVMTSATRILVPDLTVIAREDFGDGIVLKTPLIVIEVLSPLDTFTALAWRIEEFKRMGVEHIWLIDPLSRKAWIATPDGSHQHVQAEFSIPNTPIRIPLAEVFAELDDMLTQLSS
jgi:Uma2 family endonuclease